VRWPGTAAVIVSVVHVIKGRYGEGPFLDGQWVQRISAYLVKGDVDESPSRLSGNPYFSLGSKIYGQGFLFADGDPDCTPIAERTRILAAHPDWHDRIPPYLVGEEINSDPHQGPTRFVISLSDVADESGLDRWPELRRVIEQKVKPERLRLGNNPNNVPLKRRWWAYQAHRPELYQRIEARRRVLCLSRVGQSLAFAFVPTGLVYSEAVVVIDLDADGGFAVLQSRVHELWARFFASSMKDDLRYTPSDCFETFPFPAKWEGVAGIDAAGKDYDGFRDTLMLARNEGLTKTYNRFHDPEECDDDVAKLRDLHGAMDCAVLEAYGWSDIPTDCEFLLDYEIDEADWGNRKKPYRYRWPDSVRDEVLARLLELNSTRASDEARTMPVATNRPGKARTKRPTKITQSEELFT
jgi:hypothetical protein